MKTLKIATFVISIALLGASALQAMEGRIAEKQSLTEEMAHLKSLKATLTLKLISGRGDAQSTVQAIDSLNTKIREQEKKLADIKAKVEKRLSILKDITHFTGLKAVLTLKLNSGNGDAQSTVQAIDSLNTKIREQEKKLEEMNT